jgi:hypothetical protein
MARCCEKNKFVEVNRMKQMKLVDMARPGNEQKLNTWLMTKFNVTEEGIASRFAALSVRKIIMKEFKSSDELVGLLLALGKSADIKDGILAVFLKEKARLEEFALSDVPVLQKILSQMEPEDKILLLKEINCGAVEREIAISIADYAKHRSGGSRIIARAILEGSDSFCINDYFCGEIKEPQQAKIVLDKMGGKIGKVGSGGLASLKHKTAGNLGDIVNEISSVSFNMEFLTERLNMEFSAFVGFLNVGSLIDMQEVTSLIRFSFREMKNCINDLELLRTKLELKLEEPKKEK